ncbi:MAG TPA: serine/threonine-protein kinase, partial [Anaerolineales bacterium]|nr:serine/threonine-protein kinase [Anaerolineales bacterium]
TVYRAFDPNFKRDVAIKVLPADYLASPHFKARFEKEATIIAKLEHPAIVPVYDYGVHEGQTYLVMRYMSGGSLAERLIHGPMSLEETTDIISRLAPALEVAHQHQIIHRDIKPANILFDQYDHAYLSDFGIARQTKADVTTLTGEQIIGTPAYMSPEQIQGEKTIDGRSDIYSLGAVIYQMLAGQVPYEADTNIAILVKHLTEPVRDIRQARPKIPKAYAEAVARAMAKKPEERFSKASALAHALQEGLKQSETIWAGRDQIRDPSIKDDQTLYGQPVAGYPDSDVANFPSPTTGTGSSRREAQSYRKIIAGILVLAGLIIVALSFPSIRQYFRGGGIPAVIAAATPTNQSAPLLTNPPQPTSTLSPSSTPQQATSTARPTFTAIIPTHTPVYVSVYIEPYCEMFDESTVYIKEHQPVIFWWRWDALTESQVRDHIASARYEIKIDGTNVDATSQSDIEYIADQGFYRISWYSSQIFLTPGRHTSSRYLEWTARIFDGWDWYGPGTDIVTEYHTCQIIVE